MELLAFIQPLYQRIGQTSNNMESLSGLEETSSTLFMMEEGADTGPIINQKNIKISK